MYHYQQAIERNWLKLSGIKLFDQAYRLVYRFECRYYMIWAQNQDLLYYELLYLCLSLIRLVDIYCLFSMNQFQVLEFLFHQVLKEHLYLQHDTDYHLKSKLLNQKESIRLMSDVMRCLLDNLNLVLIWMVQLKYKYL